MDSLRFLKSHWLCWKVVGATVNKVQPRFRVPYICYAFALHVLVTFGNPFHLAMFLFRSPTVTENIQNIAVTVSTGAVSIKFVIYMFKFGKVYEIEQLLQILDQRVHDDEQHLRFQQVRRQVRNIVMAYLFIYFLSGFTRELAFIFGEGGKLLFPAWFPFNWHDSLPIYVLANVYQLSSLCMQLIESYACDCFPPVILCLICGHLQLLAMRVARIGFDGNMSWADNERELQRCIADQKNLYRLFETLEELMSWPLFIQFCTTAFNMCFALAAFMFLNDSPWDRLYYFAYFIGMPTQIFSTCYYGTKLQDTFSNLQYALFSCNWMDQSPKFKRNMMIFSERSLRKTTALAGGMVRVHIDTFFAECKGAYSLFCVIMQLKN